MTTKFEGIAAHYRNQIRSGQLQPGDKIPSITQLQKLHKVSYGVIRAATHRLKSEGLIFGQPGEGVYVNDQKQWRS